MSLSGNSIISEISRTAAVVANPPAAPPTPAEPTTSTLGAAFQINSAKLFVPVVTLFINDNIKFLKHMKQGFKRTVSWNKSEITAP